MTKINKVAVYCGSNSGKSTVYSQMVTWSQLGFHEKPCAILNIGQYYDHLLKFLDHAETEGFIKKVHRDMIVVENKPDRLIQRLNSYEAPCEKKWIINDPISN